jgi:hypothetical protein
LQYLAVLIPSSSKVTERIVDIDWLIVMPFLSADRLTIPIRVEGRRMPKRRDLKVKRQVLAEAVNVIHDKRLIRDVDPMGGTTKIGFLVGSSAVPCS